MDNFHRALAPISAAAWADIEAEAKRTLCRYMGARRAVDLCGPNGYDFSAVNLGEVQAIDSAFSGVLAAQRRILPLVELKVPFKLMRKDIDDVARGSQSANWQPVKDAALSLATAENRMVFDGFAAAGIMGIAKQSSNKPIALPKSEADIPFAVEKAVDALREAGVEGPYVLVLGDDVHARIMGGSENGYPLKQHLRGLVDQDIVWCPGLSGGMVLTARGGDFNLYLGQDATIGYDSHTATDVTLYMFESATFKVETTEASVVLKS